MAINLNATFWEAGFLHIYQVLALEALRHDPNSSYWSGMCFSIYERRR